jgi:hypothetical protein
LPIHATTERGERERERERERDREREREREKKNLLRGHSKGEEEVDLEKRSRCKFC